MDMNALHVTRRYVTANWQLAKFLRTTALSVSGQCNYANNCDEECPNLDCFNTGAQSMPTIVARNVTNRGTEPLVAFVISRWVVNYRDNYSCVFVG
jgi:hypothetical protein